MDLSLLKPVLVAEGQKLIDEVLFPELKKILEDKIVNPVLESLVLQLLDVMKQAADNELQSLLK